MPGLTVVHLSVAGTYVCLLTMFCFAVKCYQVVGNGGMGWSCFTIWSWVHHLSCCYVLVAWQKLNLSLLLKHLPTARHLLKTVCFGLLMFTVICLLLLITGQLHTTHTRLTALFPGLPGWAGTRKVKPIWILLKQEAVCGSGISWAVCKSASRFRQITTPAPHHSVFYWPDALPATQPTASKHWTVS